MDTIRKSAPVEFLLDEAGAAETVEVQELTIAQMEELSRTAHRAAQEAWGSRIRAVTAGLPEGERQRVLVASAAQPPDLDSDKSAWITSNEGIKKAFEIHGGRLAKIFAVISAIAKNSDAIIAAWRIIMGIIEEVKKEGEPEESPLA